MIRATIFVIFLFSSTVLCGPQRGEEDDVVVEDDFVQVADGEGDASVTSESTTPSTRSTTFLYAKTFPTSTNTSVSNTSRDVVLEEKNIKSAVETILEKLKSGKVLDTYQLTFLEHRLELNTEEMCSRKNLADRELSKEEDGEAKLARISNGKKRGNDTAQTERLTELEAMAKTLISSNIHLRSEKLSLEKKLDARDREQSGSVLSKDEINDLVQNKYEEIKAIQQEISKTLGQYGELTEKWSTCQNLLSKTKSDCQKKDETILEILHSLTDTPFAKSIISLSKLVEGQTPDRKKETNNSSKANNEKIVGQLTKMIEYNTNASLQLSQVLKGNEPGTVNEPGTEVQVANRALPPQTATAKSMFGRMAQSPGRLSNPVQDSHIKNGTINPTLMENGVFSTGDNTTVSGVDNPNQAAVNSTGDNTTASGVDTPTQAAVNSPGDNTPVSGIDDPAPAPVNSPLPVSVNSSGAVADSLGLNTTADSSAAVDPMNNSTFSGLKNITEVPESSSMSLEAANTTSSQEPADSPVIKGNDTIVPDVQGLAGNETRAGNVTASTGEASSKIAAATEIAPTTGIEAVAETAPVVGGGNATGSNSAPKVVNTGNSAATS